MVSPVLQHLGMGLGLGGLGFLLVVGVRGGADAGDGRKEVAAAAVTANAPSATHLESPTSDAGDEADVRTSVTASSDAPSAAESPPPPVFRVASLAGDPALALADGTVGKRPFLTALGASGIARAEAYRVYRALTPVHNLNHTSPADAFHFAKDKTSGRVVAFEYVTSPVTVFQARALDDGGTLTAKKLDLHVDLRRIALPVTVTEDLRASVAKAGFDPEILSHVDDALDGHAELVDVHAGARLRLVATEERLDGVFLRYASLDALEYTAGARGATPLRVYRFPALDKEKVLLGTASHGALFYDDKGQQPYHGGWRIPVPSARIASRFNPHRMHPTLHVVMPHNGVDFAAPTGTPIYAAASGVVKTAGDSGPCGNMVQIDHPSGIISSYCHLSRFASGVHVGEHVETRQLIGYVGQTGRATGPHLHFAIKRNGVFIDPLAMKLDGVRVVPPSQRDAFDSGRVDLDKALDAVALDPVPAGTVLEAPSSLAAQGAGQFDAGPDAPLDDQVFDETP